MNGKSSSAVCRYWIQAYISTEEFMDANIWGFFAVLLGVFICWGSVIWGFARADKHE
jgi:hypothetical protein